MPDPSQSELFSKEQLEEVITAFILESTEGLARMEGDLIALEKDPESREHLDSAFRCVHTIKGTCGFFGYTKLEALSHAGESLLGRLRSGQLALSNEIVSRLLELVDAIRNILSSIESSRSEGDYDSSALLDHLDGCRATVTPTAAPAVLAAVPAAASQASRVSQTPEPAADSRVAGSSSQALSATESGGTRPPIATPIAATTTAATAEPPAEPSPGPSSSESTIRVDVRLLDRLMNLVSELVLARNQVLQLATRSPDPTLAVTSQRLDLVTSQLQDEVMQLRMQSIACVWQMLPRLVRDLARTCGKEVRLEMEGQDTELDRALVEAVKDPLIHLVRNCIDHGIEDPKTRLEAGKPREGLLRLSAFHEKGTVTIEISDDGAGIDLEKVKRRAVQSGLARAEELERMDSKGLSTFIFLPGFSTADKVTNVSGRGVGLDIVKTRIEQTGGTVEMQTLAGRGTTFRLKIPLTLASIPALFIETHGQQFAVQQSCLLELVRPGDGAHEPRIEMIHSSPVLRLRGSLLPIVRLAAELGIATAPPVEESTARPVVLVVQAEDHPMGILVDKVHHTEDIVIKPLSKAMRHVSLFSGATIRGDGRLALVLDVAGLARHARVLDPGRTKPRGTTGVQASLAAQPECLYLVVLAAGGARLAIPIEPILRIEPVLPSDIQHVSGGEVFIFHGEALPLLRPRRPSRQVIRSEAPPMPTPVEGARKANHVVVCLLDGRKAGLFIERVIDTVAVPEDRALHGAAGSSRILLLDSGLTEVVDLDELSRLVAARRLSIPDAVFEREPAHASIE